MIKRNSIPALDNLPLPVLLADRSYALIYANNAADILGRYDDPAKKHCYNLFHDYAEPCRVPLNECPVRSFLETGETLTVADSCCPGRTISSFDGGLGLTGLMLGNPVGNELEGQRVIHTGKMAALGAMLVHIVHNLNSSFYVAGNYLNVLKKKLEHEISREEILRYLGHIDSNNRLAADMIRTLLDYTRQKESEQRVYAREAVAEVVSIFDTALASSGIETRILDTGNGPEVNRHALLTVLFCVIQNAVEAMPGGGRLEIAINERSVTISDQGGGIPPETMKKLFTPYFTTSASGTGLGLYIARMMMRGMNGEITISSKIGEGTEVRLAFLEGQNANSGN